jgi:signal peptidase I
MERKPLVAMAGSLIMPGLGQVYNGELSKGLSLFLLFAFVLPVFSFAAVRGPSSWLFGCVLIAVISGLAIYFYCVRDAYVAARRIGVGYRPLPFNQPHFYLGLLFFGYFFVLGQLSDYVKRDLIQAFKIPSLAKSMEPSILPGDQFFADKRINSPGTQKVRRGDAAVFIYPNDRTTIYVKRVIGLPGDQIEIHNDDVLVNGTSIRGEEVENLGSRELNAMLPDHVAYREHGDKEDYIVLWKRNRPTPSLKFSVPNGQVFVLGDNRDESSDSRHFGPVSLNDIIGKARQVYFSRGPQGIRLGRIGTRLD